MAYTRMLVHVQNSSCIAIHYGNRNFRFGKEAYEVRYKAVIPRV